MLFERRQRWSILNQPWANLIEMDVACTSETLLLLAYAVASLRPKSHACSETGFSGAQTAYVCHKMPGIVHNFNFSAEYRQEMNMK